MTNISLLSNQILMHVFSQLDEMAQIAECRLVCKAWNIPGERAMLGHIVKISADNAKMQTLYSVLNKEPTKGSWIKHLHFEINADKPCPQIIRNMLPLAFTPNIEAITGYISGAELFEVLLTILQHSPVPFDKLKVQQLSSDLNECPLNLALEFKGSLQELQLVVSEPIVNKVQGFQRLMALSLTAFLGSIASLDKLLDNCPHLQEMCFKTWYWRVDRPIDLYWSPEAIRRNNTLELLIIKGLECPPDMMEYLAYKFANLKTIVMCVPADSHVSLVLQELSRKIVMFLQSSTDKKSIKKASEDNDCELTLKHVTINANVYSAYQRFCILSTMNE
ncbi:hypothetical protein MBANPS3_004489 [Mucor bainieri]